MCVFYLTFYVRLLSSLALQSIKPINIRLKTIAWFTSFFGLLAAFAVGGCSDADNYSTTQASFRDNNPSLMLPESSTRDEFDFDTNTYRKKIIHEVGDMACGRPVSTDPVQSRYLELSDLSAQPDIVTPFMETALTVGVKVHPSAFDDKGHHHYCNDGDDKKCLALRWVFKIRSTDTCKIVRTLVGKREVISPNLEFFISANWDGKDKYGNRVPSGTYLYRVTASLVKCEKEDDPSHRHRYRKCIDRLTTAQQALEVHSIINEVILEKTQVCIDESFLVEVIIEHFSDPPNDIKVAIDGIPGTSRYLHFPGEAGPRRINVTASTPDKLVDSRTVIVDVIACDPDVQFAKVDVRPNPYHIHTADFWVTNADELDPVPTSYKWDFGDGQAAETDVPYVSHYYGDNLTRDDLYTQFQATIAVERPGLPDLITPKSITVWNIYGFNKRRGLLQPKVISNEVLEKVGNYYKGNYEIFNLEDQPIDFTLRRTELLYCDPEREPFQLEEETVSIIIGGKLSLMQYVDLPLASVPSNVCGLAVHLTGQAMSSFKVAADVYFEIQINPLFQQMEADPVRLQLLNQIAAQGLVSDPNHITEEDLYRLAQEGRIILPEYSSNASLWQSNTEIGEACVPGDTPPRIGLTCQATDEWTVSPPLIRNALKGDILLKADCGMVGEMLRKMEHRQMYSHVGIMTRNYYEITHSTTSEERYGDHSGSDGISKSVLKYGWPGVVNQSIHQTFHGQYLYDPDGQGYKIKSFSPKSNLCKGDDSVIYPLVIKPPVGSPQEVRHRLHQAADIAKTSKGHYRWYGYSNGSIALDEAFNGPDGSAATVCSTFIWSALKKAGIVLEGESLEDEDEIFGAKVDELTADGLYVYSEDDRKAGSRFIYDTIYNKVYDQAGWFIDLFTDVADDMANQLVNCMASDRCDGRATNSPPLRLLGEANASSTTFDPNNGYDMNLFSYWESDSGAPQYWELAFDYPPTDRVKLIRARLNDYAKVDIYVMIDNEWQLLQEGAIAQSNGWIRVPIEPSLRIAGVRFEFNYLGSFAEARVYELEASVHWPGDGRTASPDNLMFWDEPPVGVYGYSERMVYRGGAWVRIHRWVPSEGTGSVSGVVMHEGVPVEGANITLAGLEEASQLDGSFEFLAVPAGQYTIEAQLLQDVLLSAVEVVIVVADQTTHVELNLVKPESVYREVVLEGKVKIYDDEWFFPESKTFSFYESCWIDPFQRTDEIHWERCVGGEVRVEIDIECHLIEAIPGAEPTVTVGYNTRLYEGTSCSTDDMEDKVVGVISLAIDESKPLYVHLENRGVGGGDYSNIDLIVTNNPQ